MAVKKQGTPKKKAAVDTVRLKRDLDHDMKISAVHNNLYGANPRSSRAVVHRTIKEGHEASARARGDSLKAARAGKIPAKKSK